MADDISELILKCGGYPSIKCEKRKGKLQKFRNGTYELKTDIYIVRWNTSRMAHVRNMEKKLIPYDGMVYCLTLEKNHVLWVKREGQTAFSGNCRCAARFYKEVPAGYKVVRKVPKGAQPKPGNAKNAPTQKPRSLNQKVPSIKDPYLPGEESARISFAESFNPWKNDYEKTVIEDRLRSLDLIHKFPREDSLSAVKSVVKTYQGGYVGDEVPLKAVSVLDSWHQKKYITTTDIQNFYKKLADTADDLATKEFYQSKAVQYGAAQDPGWKTNLFDNLLPNLNKNKINLTKHISEKLDERPLKEEWIYRSLMRRLPESIEKQENDKFKLFYKHPTKPDKDLIIVIGVKDYNKKIINVVTTYEQNISKR